MNKNQFRRIVVSLVLLTVLLVPSIVHPAPGAGRLANWLGKQSAGDC